MLFQATSQFSIEKIFNKMNNNFVDFEKIHTFAPQNEM